MITSGKFTTTCTNITWVRLGTLGSRNAFNVNILVFRVKINVLHWLTWTSVLLCGNISTNFIFLWERVRYNRTKVRWFYNTGLNVLPACFWTLDSFDEYPATFTTYADELYDQCSRHAWLAVSISTKKTIFPNFCTKLKFRNATSLVSKRTSWRHRQNV